MKKVLISLEELLRAAACKECGDYHDVEDGLEEWFDAQPDVSAPMWDYGEKEEWQIINEKLQKELDAYGIACRNNKDRATWHLTVEARKNLCLSITVLSKMETTGGNMTIEVIKQYYSRPYPGAIRCDKCREPDVSMAELRARFDKSGEQVCLCSRCAESLHQFIFGE